MLKNLITKRAVQRIPAWARQIESKLSQGLALTDADLDRILKHYTIDIPTILDFIQKYEERMAQLTEIVAASIIKDKPELAIAAEVVEEIIEEVKNENQ